MQFPNKKILIIAGNNRIKKNSLIYFDETVLKFLSVLSKDILKNREAQKYADLVSFGFWIREKNLFKIKSDYNSDEIRFGHGLSFHITPSNIALNFAYSFVLSLLAGNSNIIRISKTKYKQKNIFFSILKKLFKEKKFNIIKNNNLFISYDNREDEITNLLSKKADCRIIWGSDKTVTNLRKMETKPLCKDLFFPDRYSVSLLSLKEIKKLKRNSLASLAKNFYLDTLLYDQNACTSPHFIIWIGKKNEKISSIFWKEVDEQIKKNKLFEANEKKMFDKYSKVCELSALRAELKKHNKIGFINLSQVSKFPKDIENFRIGNGYFFEIYVKDIKAVNLNFNKKIQTITYYGFNKSKIEFLVKSSSLLNADRIVPVGRALEFDKVWDGYDLIRSLSKITYVQ